MEPAFQPGHLFAGKYLVERFIGKGGSGFVLVARHTLLRQKVALKLLHDEMAKMPEVVARFLREAEAAARLASPHTTRIMDAGRLEDGRPYIVMEYLEGRDLRVVVQEEGPLSPAVAARYIAQACEGLAEAHARGIVHRDLKPSNLFLTFDAGGRPLVKVLDFGISKVLPQLGQSAGGLDVVTRAGQLLGSLHFMSPEQMRSARDVDARTDVWSLGATLFVLVTGRFPFRGAGLVDLLTAMVDGPRPTLGPGAPAELDAVVARCLSADVSARYASVAELARALAPIAGALAAAEPASSAPRPSGSHPPSAPPIVVERAASTARSRRAVPAVVMVAATIALGVWGAPRRPSSQPTPPETTKAPGPATSGGAAAAPSPRDSAPEPPAASTGGPTWAPGAAASAPIVATSAQTLAAQVVPAASSGARRATKRAGVVPSAPGPGARSSGPPPVADRTPTDFDIIRALPH